MILFKEGLSLITRRLSFNPNTNFLSSLVSTLRLSKHGGYKVTNDSTTLGLNSTTLGLNFLLSQRLDSDMLLNSYIKVSYTLIIIGLIAESTMKFINDTRCKFFWSVIFKDPLKAFHDFKKKHQVYGVMFFDM